jgi:hypothetical protein
MAIAFKEWVLVCDALGSGEQSLLLRKGGIAEGYDGFGFEHTEFYLFPTWFHAQVEKVRGHTLLPKQIPDFVTLSYAATIEWSDRLNDKEAVRRLSELHILQESVIEERFQYDNGKSASDDLGKESSGRGIHVAFVRIYRLEPAVTLPMDSRFGGCRSWVEIPEIEPEAMVSVLSDEEHARRKNRFSELLGVKF